MEAKQKKQEGGIVLALFCIVCSQFLMRIEKDHKIIEMKIKSSYCRFWLKKRWEDCKQQQWETLFIFSDWKLCNWQVFIYAFHSYNNIYLHSIILSSCRPSCAFHSHNTRWKTLHNVIQWDRRHSLAYRKGQVG